MPLERRIPEVAMGELTTFSRILSPIVVIFLAFQRRETSLE